MRKQVRGYGFFILQALKNASLTALLVFGLTVLLVGVRTVQETGRLWFETRWTLVVIAVAVSFALHFFIGICADLYTRLAQRKGSISLSRYIPKVGVKIKPVISFALIGFAVSLPFYPFADRYVIDTATLVLTYIMLGWGLNIVVGLAGLLDLGYVAFYAVGAYCFALLAHYYGLSFWICLPLCGILAAFFGILLGFPVLRLRGDYLAIVTLGFGEIIRVILLNWYNFTGGPNGISNIPRPSFFGLVFKRVPEDGDAAFHTFFGIDYSSMHQIIFFYYLILLLALLTNVFTIKVRKLPIGRAWEALREDEIACRSIGINPRNTKLTAFALGAMFAGFAGAFFAARQGFISPESFTFSESAIIVAIVVLGGMGSQLGIVIAAIVLIGATEFFRSLSEYRMLTFGALMIAIMLWKPQGLISHREPTITLGAKDKHI
ncbi:leucine/isoleucine/valine transporter permease subunit [Candidatus Magnetoovum chiemensis]|nr:leucine/isoleucine/valine transporter permease subunit [Candidatus Magnetoovum chiemensis]